MTAFDEIIQGFYHYIENDADFFHYFELSEEECMKVAEQRSSVLLKEAASYLSRKIVPLKVFSLNADETGFAETLNYNEQNLLVKAMFLCYLQRDIAKLRAFEGYLTSSDLNIFSPANERKTFSEMVSAYEDQLKIEISEYCMLDRITGEFRQICT